MNARLLLPVAFALVAAAAPARADVLVTLKPSLDVAGETIALSDIFEGVPAESDAALARAPSPGATLTFEPGWLQQRARRAGLAWDNASGARRVSVRRLSQSLGSERIAEMIRDELARREHAEYAVALDRLQALHAPLDAALAPQVASLTLDPATRMFSAEIVLASTLEPARITGRAEPSVALPVLTRAVPRGAMIDAADITYLDMPASRVPANALDDPDAIVGMAAKRALRPGLALKAFDIEQPTVIERGDVVVIRFERGALVLTARARALTDVADGEQARFVNVQSSRVIEAVATGPGEAWLVAAASLDVQGARP